MMERKEAVEEEAKDEKELVHVGSGNNKRE